MSRPIPRSPDLLDILSVTNIGGSKIDSPDHPPAPGGMPDSNSTLTEYQKFVQYTSALYLARFGLHNGAAAAEMLITSKWESLVLAPAFDDDEKDHYFLLTPARWAHWLR